MKNRFYMACTRDQTGSNMAWHSVNGRGYTTNIDCALYRPKTMTQGAGLKIPEHIKRDRRRRDSGQTRWNCPECGRINWQGNPYYFMGCSNISCDQWHSKWACEL